MFSEYFEDLVIQLRAPKTSLLIGIPIKNKGRIEVIGELVYRIYNIEEVPYFFSATEPPGLTKTLRLMASAGFGFNTVLSLIYQIEFPPEEEFKHNLRFQTRIRF
jgi:uncharacterized membrane protein